MTAQLTALPTAFSPTFAIDISGLFDLDFLIGILGVTAGVYALFALGLQLNVGFTGIVNFGQAGFMAIGAYSMGILVTMAGVDFWLALVLAILIAMAFGLLVGLPALRLRADYLAIATIAAAEIVRLVARNAAGLTGGNQGLACNPEGVCYDDQWRDIEDGIGGFVESTFGSDVDALFPLFLVVWATVILVTALLYFAQRTPWGRVLRAVREDEDAARALGKNTLAYKLQSLAISAGIGAIAGYFLVFNLGTISPTEFEPLFTFIGYGVLLLGGLANYWGVAIGGIIMWFLIEGTRQVDLPISPEKQAAPRFVIVGIVIIALMAFRPQGMFGKRQEMVLGD